MKSKEQNKVTNSTADQATNQVGEEVVSLVLTTEQVSDVLGNRVGLAELGENGQAETEIEVAGNQRFA